MSLGADFLATGHYCHTQGGRLFQGKDPGKDQSYFLQAVSSQSLQKVLFPLGQLLKSQVRQIAKDRGLPCHNRRDSTGICFIGERPFQDFLKNYLPVKKGFFRSLDGKIQGEHLGVPYYTLGQRRHLGLGGQGAPWYVVAKDLASNTVYVERGREHPKLYSIDLETEKPHWIHKPSLPQKMEAKIRYRQKNQSCEIHPLEDGGLRLRFQDPQWAPTACQYVAIYQGEECLGGASIRRVLSMGEQKQLS